MARSWRRSRPKKSKEQQVKDNQKKVEKPIVSSRFKMKQRFAIRRQAPSKLSDQDIGSIARDKQKARWIFSQWLHLLSRPPPQDFDFGWVLMRETMEPYKSSFGPLVLEGWQDATERGIGPEHQLAVWRKSRNIRGFKRWKHGVLKITAKTKTLLHTCCARRWKTGSLSLSWGCKDAVHRLQFQSKGTLVETGTGQSSTGLSCLGESENKRRLHLYFFMSCVSVTLCVACVCALVVQNCIGYFWGVDSTLAKQSCISVSVSCSYCYEFDSDQAFASIAMLLFIQHNGGQQPGIHDIHRTRIPGSFQDHCMVWWSMWSLATGKAMQQRMLYGRPIQSRSKRLMQKAHSLSSKSFTSSAPALLTLPCLARMKIIRRWNGSWMRIQTIWKHQKFHDADGKDFIWVHHMIRLISRTSRKPRLHRMTQRMISSSCVSCTHVYIVCNVWSILFCALMSYCAHLCFLPFGSGTDFLFLSGLRWTLCVTFFVSFDTFTCVSVLSMQTNVMFHDCLMFPGV